MIFGTNIISGNVSTAGTTVNFSGAASGSVTSDVAGNYVIPTTTNGHTVTPSGSFSPATQNATISSADVAGLNFTVSAGTGPGTTFYAKPISVTLVNAGGDALSFTSPTTSGNNGQPEPICFTDPNGNEYASSGAAIGSEIAEGTPVVLCNSSGQAIVPPFAFTTNASTITFSGTLSGQKLGGAMPPPLLTVPFCPTGTISGTALS
jgi:hypothetical protein